MQWRFSDVPLVCTISQHTACRVLADSTYRCPFAFVYTSLHGNLPVMPSHVSCSLQRAIYDETAYPIVESVLEGFNGTLFAYGQTGQ